MCYTVAHGFLDDCPQELKHDLLDIFSALGDLQYQYDWFITDHDLWYTKNCPEEVRRRWQWTGLLMDGTELTAHLSVDYVHFILGGVLSAVPKVRSPVRSGTMSPTGRLKSSVHRSIVSRRH